MAASAENGFGGSVTALSVADVLQLQSGSRFSGSIVFMHHGQEAAIYMQHGEVIHAELGDVRGEAVLAAVLAWPSGNFQAHANVATFARTIEKRLDHLLLESARQIDEARQAGDRPPARGAARPQAPSNPPSPADRARAVSGVACAAVLKGGVAVGDPSPEAAALAARSNFLLSVLANPLGKALGLAEVTSAALSTRQSEQLLLIHSKEAYLAVSLPAEASLPEVEAEVRRAVSARPGA